MASPALLLGAAAAALLLLGRKSGNATAEATLGSGVATTGGGASDPEATITVVQWDDLWGGGTGTPSTAQAGSENSPIDWPVALAGDRLEIRGAPLTFTLSTTGQDMEKSYMVAFQDPTAAYSNLGENVEIKRGPATSSLILESIKGYPMGALYIKHTADRIRYIYVNG